MKKFLGMANAVTMTAFFGVFLWSAYGVFALGRVDLYSENGSLENLQAVVLAIACLTFLLPVVLEKRSDKLILLFCSLLCYAFVLRELNIEEFDIPDAIKYLGYGKGRNITIAAALILIFSFALFNFSYYAKRALCFLRSVPGTFMLMAGAFLILGEFFEKGLSFAHHVFFEEIFELLGDVFILMAAFAVNSFFGKNRKTSGADLSLDPDSARACAPVPPPR